MAVIYQKSFMEKAEDTFLYIFLSIAAFTAVYPFIHLLVLSLNDSIDAQRGGLYFWPRVFTLANYEYVFTNESLLRASFNSVARTVIQTVVSIFCTGMIAYCLSRREFVFRRSFSFLLIVTMYVSGGLIPAYLLIKGLGLMNTFAVYIVPGLISAYHVLIMRTFFEQLPDGLVESAYMDGANDFSIFLRIIMPISLPVIACIALFVAVGEWNAWFDNFLYNSRNKKLTVLQYELQKMVNAVQQGGGENDPLDSGKMERVITPYTVKATLTIIVTVPILLVYPFLQKYFVKGLTLGAMKD
jgi:putative aldouronate transport system permease protein